MKTHLKKASLLFTGLLVGGKLFAQTADTTNMSGDYVKPFSPASAYRTWSIGINGGVINPFTIFGTSSKQDFTGPNTKLGYSGYINYQILPSFGLRAEYLGGKIAGHDAQPDATGTSPFQSYETKLNYGINLSGTFTLANINWRHNKGVIQPYLTAGAGVMSYSPVLKFADGSTQPLGPGSNKQHAWYVPVGVGFKFDVAPGVNVDLGYTANFAYADDVDGYAFGSTNDKFSYAHLGLEFALGSRRKPQLATHNPVSSMRTEYMLENHKTRAELEAEIAAERAKNDQLRNDLNTTNANLAKLTVDSDGDGVIDMMDKCPNTPPNTKVDGSGCPLPEVKQVTVITEEDRRVVKDAIANLEFDFGKATIREHSYASLEKVANLLVNKNFSLKLAGHTDNVGRPEANMKLSKERAEAVKSFLVSKGANPSRIEATGYGETQPIASNKTAAGRQQNRRVEFTLY